MKTRTFHSVKCSFLNNNVFLSSKVGSRLRRDFSEDEVNYWRSQNALLQVICWIYWISLGLQNNPTCILRLIFLYHLSTLYFRDWKMILWTQNPSTGRALNKPSAWTPITGWGRAKPARTNHAKAHWSEHFPRFLRAQVGV